MYGKLLSYVVLLVLLPFSVFSQKNWTVQNGDVTIKIKNAGITVTGRFSGLKATLRFSPDKLETSILKGTVQVATLKTGIDKRDRDLMEDKYFNEPMYKFIEVASTKLYKKGNAYAGFFNITVKGVTKQMELPVDVTMNGSQIVLKTNFTIDRRDFGVGEKSLTMSDNVDVYIDVKAN